MQWEKKTDVRPTARLSVIRLRSFVCPSASQLADWKPLSLLPATSGGVPVPRIHGDYSSVPRTDRRLNAVPDQYGVDWIAFGLSAALSDRIGD